MTKATTTEDSKITTMKRSLAQREDLAGQTYRAVRDNPKTSAAIATGVAAAAAGTTAFLINRKNKLGTATGHASADSEIVEKVKKLNEENIS